MKTASSIVLCVLVAASFVALTITATSAATVTGTAVLSDFTGDKTLVPLAVQVIFNNNVVGSDTIFADLSGKYTILNVPNGIYDIWVKPSHWLAFGKRGVVINGDTDLGTVTFINGDANNDNVIGMLDVGTLRRAWNKTSGQSGYSANADVNGDGVVDATDLGIVKASWGQRGDTALVI